MTKIIDQIEVEKYSLTRNITIRELLQLYNKLDKLRKWDEYRDCFGDLTTHQILRELMKTDDLFALNYEHLLMGGLLIGNCEEDQYLYNIAITLKREYRGQGIGTEMVKRAIKTCFEDYNSLRVCLGHNYDNLASKYMIFNSGIPTNPENREIDVNYRFNKEVEYIEYFYTREAYIRNYQIFEKVRKLTR